MLPAPWPSPVQVPWMCPTANSRRGASSKCVIPMDDRLPGLKFSRGAADHRKVSLPATPATTTDGVRLMSHRPSVLFKVEHHATEPAGGDISVEGIVIS